MTTPPVAADPDVVLLTVPADGAYLGVLRTAAAGLAARLRFSLQGIEDVRIAVDEACAMLLPVASAGAELRCRFASTGDELMVEVAVDADPAGGLPPASSFAWQVLRAHADRTTTSVTGRTATISLAVRRSAG